MEIGRLPDIDNVKQETVVKLSQVKDVENDNKVIQDDKYKESASKSEGIEDNEILLDNVRFGYNTSSKDFYVKVTEGNSEYKFPTENMMKLKEALLNSVENSTN